MKLNSVAKAIAAGLAAVIGSLLLLVQGPDTLADVTQSEWLLVAFNLLGVYGVTWSVPNRP